MGQARGACGDPKGAVQGWRCGPGRCVRRPVLTTKRWPEAETLEAKVARVVREPLAQQQSVVVAVLDEALGLSATP
jgi:hypothetical protein